MAKKKFITGALWLTLTGVVLRLVGMVYRVYITSKLGEEGMGLYQLILSVYTLGSAFASAGVSIAVTRLVSAALVQGGRAGVQKIMRFALGWSMTLGTLVSLVLGLAARGIAAHLIGAPESVSGLRILAVGLPFMAASACFNGYFLAVSRVHYSCLAQVAEQVVRIGVVALLIDRFAAISYVAGCNAVFVGNAASEIAAMMLLGLFYLKDVGCLQSGGWVPDNIYAKFLPIQLPIAASKYISSLLHTAENLLVPSALEKYSGARSQALSDFGVLKGMALPLIMFPSSFLSSLAGLLIPEITAAAALRRQEKIKLLTRRTLQITFIFSLMMGGLFYRFAYPLGKIIYRSEEVGRILKWLSPVIPFMYLDCITDGLLKGIGEQMASLRYSTTDSLVRIALVFVLLPFRGLDGFLVIMAISNCSVALLGLRRLVKVTECSPPWMQGVLMPLVGIALAHLLTRSIEQVFLAGAAYLLIFIIFMFLSGAVRLSDLKALFKPADNI